jgi:putative ABC transport system substrate-binding protein
MKRCFAILVLLFLVFAFTAYSEEKLKIGTILQIDIPPFKLQVDGFKKGLENAGYTKDNTEIIEMNAAGKMDAIKGMTDDLRKANVKLIVVIGTSAAIEVLKYVKDIPVVASVSYAESLREAAQKFNYGNNYAAGLMYVPHAPLIKLALKIGNFKTFGMIYNQNEDNSKKEAVNLTSACKAMGLSSVAVPYADENGLLDSFNTLIKSKIDCVLFTKDTLVVKHMADIVPLITSKKIKAVTIDEGSLDASIIGISIDMSALGVVLSNIALDILKNGKKPSDIAPKAMEKFMLIVNLKEAKAVGVNIPVELISTANKVIKE